MFNSNPELSSIGTQEQYSQYLDTIFPNSKVKDIVYHGSSIKKLEEVDKRFYITYYTNNLEYVKSFNLKNKYISAAIVNINNPLYTNKPIADASPENTTYISPRYTEDIYDSVIGKDAGYDMITQQTEGYTIAVKNNVVDTHILGSQQDIQGFKKFVSSNVIPEQRIENINYQLKSVNILSSDKADKVFKKGNKNNWDINKILSELNIPKEQQELIKSFNTINREEIIYNLLAYYSYAIEINITTEANKFNTNVDEYGDDLRENFDDEDNSFYYNGYLYEKDTKHIPFGFARFKDNK